MKIHKDKINTHEQVKHKTDGNGNFDCEGICPQCGSDDLDYNGQEEPNNGQLYSYYSCNDCKCIAYELYELTYAFTKICTDDNI